MFMFTPLYNQRGQAMMAVGIGMLAFLGFAALAVDVGHMAFTATEVQAVADAAATAAAARFSVLEGETVASQNSVAGNPAPSECIDDPAASSTCIEFGIWNGTQFTGDPVSRNAAQATVRVVAVPNIVAGIFGLGESTVTKVAVAAVKPSLPLALGEGPGCGFGGAACGGPPIPIDLGSSFHTPDAGWSTFHTDNTCGGSADDCILNEMPVECGFGALGQPMPVLEANVTSFTVDRRHRDRPSRALANCVNSGTRTTFVIPYFDCQGPGAPTFSAVPVGFETIVISNVTPPGAQDADHVQMQVQLSCATAPTQVALVK